MAAAAEEDEEAAGPDGETFIEKYTRGVSAVETILTLDRLRQSVAVKVGNARIFNFGIRIQIMGFKRDLTIREFLWDSDSDSING